MRFSSQESSTPSNRSRFRERNVIYDPHLDFLDRAQFEEMYEGKERRRSQSRERKTCNSKGSDRFSLHTHVPKTTFDNSLEDSVPVHGCSFDLEYKHASSKKVYKSPIKAKKELSKEKENEKAPTNLIARLMGLDPLPPALAKQQKGRRPSSPKTPYTGIHNIYSNKEVEYIHTSNNKYQEFKDVYEIKERPRFEHLDDVLLRNETLSLESNEFNDALIDIDGDQNNFYKFIQEHNSRLKKHLRDLKSSPLNPHANQITILKPSSKYDKEVLDMPERKSGQSVKEHRCSVPYKSSPPYKGKTSNRHQSGAQIVVLKPSLERAWNFKVVEKSNQNNFSDFEKQQIFKCKKPYNVADEVYHKGLREIAREVTKQLRTATVSSDKITSVKTLDSDHLNSFSDNLGASSYYPTESKVSREAKKHLSQRYKKVQQTQAIGIESKGINTLEDLLVFDREKSRNTPNRSNIWNHERMDISSKEVWKERKPRTLSMSKSLPASFSVSDNYKQNKRNRVAVSDSISVQGGVLDTNSKKSSIQSLRMRYPNSNAQLYSCGEDNELYEKEIHVNSEELHSRVHSRHYSKEDCMDDDQHIEQFKDVGGQVNDREIIVKEVAHDKIKEVDCNEANHNSSQYEVLDSMSSVCFKEDQPTPVSVLESISFEEDQSSPECFEKISENLKELRMQLRLLKLESADTDDECELVISSDEDVDGGCDSKVNSSEAVLEAFKSDEDRDYSYLSDVVTNSNVHPIDNELFQELEKKYSKLSSWSRSERKLLFDLINSSLFAPQSMNLEKSCPKFDGENIAEEIWQFVVKQRMKLSCNNLNKVVLDPGWFVFGEDLNIIAKELEKMLIDDLIEEELI